MGIEDPVMKKMFIIDLYSYNSEGYDMLVNAIIRPPRALYTEAELGPPEVSLGHFTWSMLIIAS